MMPGAGVHLGMMLIIVLVAATGNADILALHLN